ncbi:TPA: hypothetical protein NVH30_003005 [Vibrio cholerae]|nr:hypothetical protein [Vibrio cholerae]HCJ7280654.1 hypothetical protein [Vibrio cholerae]HCJ7318308.1 hypothetical protein [Vibrio cholerae]
MKNPWKSESRLTKSVVIVFSLLLIVMFIHAFYLAHKIDLQAEKANQVIIQAENGILESKPAGKVANYRPLLSNTKSLLLSESLKISGTIIELDNGEYIGVGKTFDAVEIGSLITEVKSDYGNLYCLGTERLTCGFARTLNIIK